MVVARSTALPAASVPVRRSATPAMRGSAGCGVPALAPARSRSSNTVPESEARVTATLLVALSLPGTGSAPPIFVMSTSTTAVLATLPPAG